MATEEKVRAHFRTASTAWGSRYAGPPRKMSDQDLLLRRENVHRLLREILAAANGARGPLRILDVGCGTGDVLDGIPRTRVRVTGIDFVREMVATAARGHPDDRFVVGDAASLPVAAESIDVVVCLGVLEYLPGPATALASIHRTLRGGGSLIVSFPNRGSLFRKISAIERRGERALLRLREALRPRRRPSGPAYRHTAWSVRGAQNLLAAADFEVQEILFNTFGLWGRPGTRRPNLAFSEWMSRRFFRESPLAAWLAYTMVVRAVKPSALRPDRALERRDTHG
jgi:SAM-dependent methyltransferase